MTTTNTTLVLVNPDGLAVEVENSYRGIKDALDDRPFDFVFGNPRFGVYIDDEGMLLELPLNLPVSMVLGRAVYGPAVCCKGATDAEGDTLPMDDEVREFLLNVCARWGSVVASAQQVGQNPFAYACEDMIPPPTIIGFDSAEEMDAYLNGEGR